MAGLLSWILLPCWVLSWWGPPPGPDVTASDSRALERLRAYLRIDTTNPPGNELQAAEFFAELFAREGIEHEVIETAPGRANVWARIDGGPEPGLVLLHHMDVVPAEAAAWQRPPFAAEVVDGVVFGRGAVDTKGLGILHLEAFLDLARSGIRPRRPVIFLGTADEEAGGRLGAGWLLERRPELFDGVGFVLTEGGGGLRFGDAPVFSIEVTQKVPLWLEVTARGRAGHASTPRALSAVDDLLRGLGRLERHAFPPRVVPEVARYLGGLADLQPTFEDAFRDLEDSVGSPRFLRALQGLSPSLHALLRNTCSVTVLQASSKINVVPSTARAEVDCRLLPDEDPEAFLGRFEDVLGSPRLEVEVLMAFAPAASPVDTELYRVLEEVILDEHPSGRVLPSVVAGFTDSHYFRSRGIVSYGFRPSLTEIEDAGGVHGNDERLRVTEFYEGLRAMRRIVERFTHPFSAARPAETGGQ